MNEERRLFPRYESDAPLKVAGGNGGFLSVDLINISLGGLQFVCDPSVRRELCPNEDRNAPVSRMELRVRLEPGPGEGRAERIEVLCRLVFCRRVAQDEYRLGLQFLEFFGAAEQDLERFVERLASLS
jgi:c-di-GMP-binding flagellar brake protein YcgR